jgi:16S rRNA (uracil1498-N3)-methyltransferase
VETRILAVQDEPSCRQTALHLGQALLQGKKMDLIVQKATELGVAGLHPFVSSYSDGIHLDAGREERRLQRWMKIAREACKQCNRPQPPAIFPVAAFDVLLAEVKSVDFDLKLIFWEEERKQGLQEIVEQKAFRSAIILVGPEGGFSAEEVHRALAVGFQAVTLGSRILRAETAAIACTAILQYLLGNLHA